ncbi:hypothetical protein D3C85_1585810 [compost metagenome]
MRMAYSVPNRSAEPTPGTRRMESTTCAETKLPSAIASVLPDLDETVMNIM